MTGQEAAEAVLAHKHALAESVTEAVYAAAPELSLRYGAAGRAQCVEDMHYNLEHLAPALELDSPALFAGYAVWLRDMLERRGVPEADVVATLHAMERVLRARLGPAGGDAVGRCVDAALQALRGDAMTA